MRAALGTPKIMPLVTASLGDDCEIDDQLKVGMDTLISWVWFLGSGRRQG